MKDHYMDNVFVLDYSRHESSDADNEVEWRLIDVGNAEQGPGPRANHTATFCEAQGGIYIFGGITAEIYATKDHPRLVEGSAGKKTVADNKVYVLSTGRAFEWEVS